MKRRNDSVQILLRLSLILIPIILIIILGIKFFLKTPKNNLKEKDNLVIEEDLETSFMSKERQAALREESKDTNSYLLLANKDHALDEDYKPIDLKVPDVKFPHEEKLDKNHLREEAANSLEELFKSAKEEENLDLFAVSGYRSYKTQVSIFQNKIDRSGLEEAERLVAKPGTSEHQTGLAMDISCHSMGFMLEEEFEDTDEGKWVKDNAHRFGFIIRYPKDKVEITKYSYEPWHLRYVGKEHAEIIYENKICLEEYLGLE